MSKRKGIVPGGRRSGDYLSPKARKARDWINANYPELRRNTNASVAWAVLEENIKAKMLLPGTDLTMAFGD